ncbi:TPA: major capsid protein [Enterobacter roggenkampii]
MLVFSRSIGERTGNLEVNQAQFRELEMARNMSAQSVADFIARARFGENGHLDAVNAVDDIRRMYRAYDQTVLAQFEPNTEFTLFNDLMPLSRSVRLEESVYEYARTGGRGWAHTSMSGQIGAALDARAYSFDGTMVPVHDSGFKFHWRDPIFNKGSALAEKYNAVVVSWTDPDNGWEQVKEYVSDDDMIARGNYNETTLEAFGCTSRGQAWRAGKWLLETAKRESSRLSFQMARDAIHFTPGDIVEVMDNNYAGARLGGRIMSHAGNKITVDAVDSSLISEGDTMSIMGSDGKFVKYLIASIADNVVTLKTMPAWVRDGTVFAISTSNVSTRLFRILSVAETDNNSVYSITASQHDPNKQAIVDEGAVFEVPNDTLNGYRVPNVENLRIINTNSETVQVTATWETATTTKKLMFEVYVYTDDGKVVAQYETDQFRYEFYGLNAGIYTLGVRGRNENGMKGAETQVSLVIGAPLAPSSVVWTPGIFSAGIVPVMRVTATSDTTFEFWYSGENQIVDASQIEDQAQFLGRASQWTLHGLKADTTYYLYVRTRNAFGTSGFVEVSGQASSDIPGMIDYIDEAIRDSTAFKNLQDGVDMNLEGQIQNALANNAAYEHQWAQYGEVKADILIVRTTIADVDHALAELSTQVQAEIGDLTSAVSEKLTAEVKSDGTASAFYTLNLGIQRGSQFYNTGFSMGIEPDGSGGYKSTTVFAADQFGIYSGSEPGNYQKAFFVFNGQVFINSAFIRNGSIDNAKIGNYIQSSTWDGTGNVGWHINKSGYAVFNNVTVRGMVYASGGKFTGTIEATSFVGDVANVGVGSDASLSGTANLVKTITYTDSGSSSLAKNALVEATFYSSVNADSRMNVIIDINGTSKTFSNLPVQSGAYANNFYTLRFGVKGINTNTVTATLTIVNANSVSKIIYSPSLTITRGTGSFVG